MKKRDWIYLRLDGGELHERATTTRRSERLLVGESVEEQG